MKEILGLLVLGWVALFMILGPIVALFSKVFG